MEKCKKKGCKKRRAPYVGTGRPSDFCTGHQPKPERKKKSDAARAAKQKDAAAASSPSPKHRPAHRLEREAAREAVSRASAKAIERSIRARRARFLAIYLDEHTSPEEAAELAGVEYETKEELLELTKSAAKWRGITEGKPEALGRILTQDMFAYALWLGATFPAASPAQSMAGMQRLADTLQRVTGKTQGTFTSLTTVYDFHEGEQWSIEGLIPPELRASAQNMMQRSSPAPGSPPPGSTSSTSSTAENASSPTGSPSSTISPSGTTSSEPDKNS